MPRILALEKNGFNDTPPGAGTRAAADRDARRDPGARTRHRRACSRRRARASPGRRCKPGEPIASAQGRVGTDARATVVQVTNLGITVKDSPQSTLVFVTRLDNGAPVPARASRLSTLDNKELWRGTTGTRRHRDGARAAAARNAEDW